MCCEPQTKCYMRLRDSIVILIEDWGVILGFGVGSLRYASQIRGFRGQLLGFRGQVRGQILGLRLEVWGLQPTLWGSRPTFCGLGVKN